MAVYSQSAETAQAEAEQHDTRGPGLAKELIFHQPHGECRYVRVGAIIENLSLG